MIEYKKENAAMRQMIISNRQEILKEVTEKIEKNLAQQKEIIENTIDSSLRKFYDKQEALSEANKLEKEKEKTAQQQDKIDQQQFDHKMEQKRDRKQDTANALLMSQITATLAEFLKTQDKRYKYQTDTPQGTTTDSVTPATDKQDRSHTPRSEPKRSRSPTDPPRPTSSKS